MRTTSNKILTVLVAFNFLWFVSCDRNDEIDLVNPQYKTLEVSCGSDFEIPVLTNNWRIESVMDVSSGKNMLNKKGTLLALDQNGKAEASNDWLILSRDKEDKFTISLKENFDKNNDRKFIICINNAGLHDYVTVTQKAGPGYKLVKSIFTEIEELRQIYKNGDGCTNIVLNNNTPQPTWKSDSGIFENVLESSDFESDDYGAFNWISEEGIKINAPDLIIENNIRWNNNYFPYKKGITTTPYINQRIANESKTLVPPHSTLYLKGEITYCKRVCNYTFTIQNNGTGTQFEVNGTWTQIVPIISHTTLSDIPFK